MTSPCRVHLSYRLTCSVLLPVAALFCLLLIGSGGAVQAQAAQQTAAANVTPAGPGNLADFLAQTLWNPHQQGPLLAIDPDSARRDKEVLTDPVRQFATLRTGLHVFHRSLFRVGSLAVIAPTEMVQVEDTPKDPPNFYDGLPRELKVKYLLATLNADQWRQLNKDGLGLGDLNEDQRKVFQSLLPDPFRYTRRPVGEKGALKPGGETVVLSPEERQQVKLRVCRTLLVIVPLANQPGMSRPHMDAERPGKPNGFRLIRDTDRDSTALYGVSFRSVLPNKPKPGPLNYASHALDASVALRDAPTVQDLIAHAAEATHLELHADMRVADLPVFSRGDHVRAGDLLQALALAVTGAYRKVDRAYVLVGDLVGSGTRQWRVAAWATEMQAKVERWETEVTRKIAQASGRDGGINGLGYAANDGYGMTDQWLAEIAKQRSESGSYHTPIEILPPALQQYIHTTVEHDNAGSAEAQHERDDQAHIDVDLKFAFQPPHDDLLDFEETGLGNALSFSRPTAQPVKEEPAPDPRPAAPLPQAAQRILFLTPERLSDVQHAIIAARTLGFTDLALRTESREFLTAAIQAARKPDGAPRIGVYAAVAPFAVEDEAGMDLNLLDRNLNGETAAEAGAARRKSPLWPDFITSVVQRTWYPERALGIASAMAPIEPALTARFHHLAALGEIAGLSGLLLYDTQPAGYAGKHELSTSFGADVRVLLEQENLGFTPAFRLDFLRRERVDPIDLIPYSMYVDTDLSLPFFPDGMTPPKAKSQFGTRDAPPGFSGMQATWDQFLGEKNRAAMAVLYHTLRAACPTLPLYVEARTERNTDLADVRYSPDYVEWTGPDLLPTTSLVVQDNGVRQVVRGARQIVMHWTSEMRPGTVRDNLLMELADDRRTLQQPNAPAAIGIDLQTISTERGLALLGECITPVRTAP